MSEATRGADWLTTDISLRNPWDETYFIIQTLDAADEETIRLLAEQVVPAIRHMLKHSSRSLST